jgi:predicted phage tail protein
VTHDIDTRDDIIADLSAKLDGALAEVERLKEDRDKAQENYQFMVNRACDEKLDGYRELAGKCAYMEKKYDEKRGEITVLKAEVEELLEELAKTTTEEEELWAEVERLKGANAAARELMATLWNSADDWHGPKASSHYRGELIEKMAVLIDRGDYWPTKDKPT